VVSPRVGGSPEELGSGRPVFDGEHVWRVERDVLRVGSGHAQQHAIEELPDQLARNSRRDADVEIRERLQELRGANPRRHNSESREAWLATLRARLAVTGRARKCASCGQCVAEDRQPPVPSTLTAPAPQPKRQADRSTPSRSPLRDRRRARYRAAACGSQKHSLTYVSDLSHA
jgi:hypothetical protein